MLLTRTEIHDLRTASGAITMSLDLIASDVKPDHRFALEMIKRNAATIERPLTPKAEKEEVHVEP